MTTEQVEEVVAEVEVKEVSAPPVADNAEILKQIDQLQKKVSVFQSEKDRAIQDATLTNKQLAQVMREKKALEETLNRLSADYSEDSDFTEKLTTHQTRSKLKAYEDNDAVEKSRQDAEKANAQFIADIKEAITDLGVDPSHKRLNEVAKTARDLPDLRKKLLKEAAMIAKGEVRNPDIDNLNA